MAQVAVFSQINTKRINTVVGRAYNCWMLNCWCITWPVSFKWLRTSINSENENLHALMKSRTILLLMCDLHWATSTYSPTTHASLLPLWNAVSFKKYGRKCNQSQEKTELYFMISFALTEFKTHNTFIQLRDGLYDILITIWHIYEGRKKFTNNKYVRELRWCLRYSYSC